MFAGFEVRKSSRWFGQVTMEGGSGVGCRGGSRASRSGRGLAGPV
jgi:hypothetical protein